MVFLIRSEIFYAQHKSQNIYFCCRAKREFFFQNLTLGYMTNTLNQIIFFFLHQHQNIFFSNIGFQNIFLEKKHNPPPFKLNGCSLSNLYIHTLLQDIKYSDPHYQYLLQKTHHSNIYIHCIHTLLQDIKHSVRRDKVYSIQDRLEVTKKGNRKR